MNSALVCNKFLQIPSRFGSKIPFHMEKKVKIIKTFLTMKLSQYHKSGSIFSSSELLLPTATAADMETSCVCIAI